MIPSRAVCNVSIFETQAMWFIWAENNWLRLCNSVHDDDILFQNFFTIKFLVIGSSRFNLLPRLHFSALMSYALAALFPIVCVACVCRTHCISMKEIWPLQFSLNLWMLLLDLYILLNKVKELYHVFLNWNFFSEIALDFTI